MLKNINVIQCIYKQKPGYCTGLYGFKIDVYHLSTKKAERGA
jgi:hypothetical protein